MATLTNFQQHVLRCLRRVPRGKVTTYAQLAQAVGKPRAVRAVGNALHVNPDAPAVPCHRVVRSDGRLGGYANGVRRKLALLRREGVRVHNGTIHLATYLFTF